MSPVLASLYEWLMFVHVVAAMVWLGGVFTLSTLSFLVVRRQEADGVGRFVSSLRIIGPVVFAPAPLLLIGFGIWMVLDTSEWSFGQTWIWLALALFGAAVLVGAGFQSRTAIAAQRAASAADTATAVRHLRRWAWGSQLILALLLLATWDMVFKPGI